VKWTKKDIRTLQGHLDTAYLIARPLCVSEWNAFEVYFAKHLPVMRKEWVLNGIRAAMRLTAERYSTACETIGNAIAREIYKDETDDFVRKWTQYARDHDADHKKAEALLHRVLREGLPPDVESYDPSRKNAASST
jgi:hypothetical protein